MTKEPSTVLETAWQHYAQFQENGNLAFKQYIILRLLVKIFAVLTIGLALLACLNHRISLDSTIGEIIKTSLILGPLMILITLSFTNKIQQGQYWQVLMTGAAAIQNAIYLYRTLLQDREERDQWLQDRVTAIYQQVVEQIGGNLVLKPYEDSFPPEDSPERKQGDLGWDDLGLNDYLNYRLEAQKNWHFQEVTRLDKTRFRLKIGVLFILGVSPILANLGEDWIIGVALTTPLAIFLVGWIEINHINERIHQYNQLIWQLKVIKNTWESILPQNRTGEQVVNLILATEQIIWNGVAIQPLSQTHQSVTELQATFPDLLAEAINNPSLTLIKPVLISSLVESIQPLITQEPIPKNDLFSQNLPHAFVVMPYGRKKGPDGRWIDFDSIYYLLIKPAVEAAGFESFRADEESVSGDILTDMLQELLLADLVVADLSIDNANVFYELGVRHALRKRGVVHIQSGRAYLPYDIFNVRTLSYHCNDNGQPDPNYLEKDKQCITNFIRSTWESQGNRIHSPLFSMLTGLPEPDRKLLQTPLATGYWQEYTEWKKRVTIAQRQEQIGDVLLLTEEVKNSFIKCEVLAEAGKALKALGNHALALQEYHQGLKLDPKNSEFRREEAFHLSRLQQYDEAITKLEWLLKDEPENIEAISYLGRIYKEVWRNEWQDIEDEDKRLKMAYESIHLLQKSIEIYLQGYRFNLNHYYSGINAVTLLILGQHIMEKLGGKEDPDYEALTQQLPSLLGAVQFCLEQQIKRDPNDVWALLSYGDLGVCIALEPQEVTRAYKKALTALWNDKFALQSPLTQLELLQSLNFRPQYVQAAIDVLQAEWDRVTKQENNVAVSLPTTFNQVFVFSGHMIDREDRSIPRFPVAMELEAQTHIEKVLEQLEADSNDLAIAGGIACGGDILFLEACLKRNMKIEVYLPLSVSEFIERSVSFAGDNWVERFYRIQNHPNVTLNFQPERLGPVPEGDNEFSRNNRWTLYSALMYGIDRVRLIVLWDGKQGDGRGGTYDMVQQVRRCGGIVEHINTSQFEYWCKSRE